MSVVTANYVDLLLPQMLEQAHSVYDRRNFRARLFQVSIRECSYATAGIVLIAINIEGLNNRIRFLLKQSPVKGSPGSWLANLLKSKKSTFPASDFQDLIDEVFVLRDVIAHNHIYKVKRGYSADYEAVYQHQTLMPGYGDNKSKRLVNTRTKLTKALRLNVQPMKIGFEELMKCLMFFDLYEHLVNRILGPQYAPIRQSYRFKERFVSNFSHILGYYVAESNNPKFWNETKRITTHFRNNYLDFIRQIHKVRGGGTFFTTDQSVVHNECLNPRCRSFGFYRVDKMGECYKCGYKLELSNIKVASTP